MNRLLLLFVLFFGLTSGHVSAATPKTAGDTLSLTWSRTMDCLNNRATFQFHVPYSYNDVDSCAVVLDDGQGRLGYQADWVYNALYATAGPKNIRLWIKKKNGQLDSLYTVINIVDSRVLPTGMTREQLVSTYPFWECAPKIGNTVVSQHWIFEEKQYDVECLLVKRPGMYILETTSATCDRYIRDTLYVKTNVTGDYMKASFEAGMLSCGVIKFRNTSETPTGIASAQWIFPDGTTSNGLAEAQYNINWGTGDTIKLIVTSISGKKDSLVRVMRAIPVKAEDVNLGRDTVLLSDDMLRLAYGPGRRPWEDSVVEANLIEWSTGAKTPYITINNAPGTYWVRVTPCLQKPEEVYTDTLIVNSPTKSMRRKMEQDSLTYIFTGSTNYFVWQYHWDFGDGTTDIGNPVTHTYSQKGFYKVKMYMETGGKIRDSMVSNLTIGPPLKADFTYQQEEERTIRYIARSTGFPGHTLRHSWFFGDGTNGTGDTIRHTYSAPGNYRVLLVTRDSISGDTEPVGRSLTVWPPLDLGKDTVFRGTPISLKINAPFYGDSSIRCVWQPGSISGQSLTVVASGTYMATVTTADGFTATDTIQVLNGIPPFTDRFDNVRDKDGKLTMIFIAGSFDPYPGTPYWSFGDASPVDTGMMIKHTYGQSGYYDVKMWRKRYPTDTTSKRIFIAPPIKVNLGPDKVMPDTLSILLNANAALDSFYRSNIREVSLIWSTGGTSDLLHITSPGVYTLTAKAYGFVSTDTIEILSPVGIRPSMSYTSKEGDASKIYFENTSQIPDISTLRWSFGDGSPDMTGPAVTHAFSQPGTYNVKLQVSTYTGYVYVVTEKVRVWPALDLGPDTTYSGVPIQLKVNEPYFSDTAVSCVWYPGAVSGKYMTVNQPGIYYVKVIAPHYAGADTIKVSQGALPGPKADFNHQRAIDGLYTMNFTNTSVVKTGNAQAFWNFGDGTAATSWNASHTYAASGTYQVKLLVQDSLGLMDSAIIPIYIRPRISINLGPDTVLRNGQPIMLEGYEAIGGAMNDIFWLWSTGDTTHRLQITTPGTYWLRATMYGYSSSDTIVVSAPPPPPPVVDSNAKVITVKDSVPVTITFPVARNANNVYTIQLANADNGPVPGARAGEPVVTDIISFPSADPRVSANIKLPDNLPCGKQYRIRVVSSSPAESSAWSQPFEVKNMPAIPLIAQRGDTLEASVAAAYQWYRNGLPVQGATSRAIRAKADGSYQVQVSAGGDCNAISAPLAMVITGLEDISLTASQLTAYPNPSSGAVYLQLEKQPAQPLLIHVYNASGVIVHSLLMKDKQTVLDLSRVPKGLYYVRVSGREKQKPVLISIQ